MPIIETKFALGDKTKCLIDGRYFAALVTAVIVRLDQNGQNTNYEIRAKARHTPKMAKKFGEYEERSTFKTEEELLEESQAVTPTKSVQSSKGKEGA